MNKKLKALTLILLAAILASCDQSFPYYREVQGQCREYIGRDHNGDFVTEPAGDADCEY